MEKQEKDGFSITRINLFGEEVEIGRKKLHERFIIPPFSVFDTKQGYWQGRKRQWMSFGIKSELGRKENLLNFSDTVRFGFDKAKKIKEIKEYRDAGTLGALPSNPEAAIPDYYYKLRSGMTKEEVIEEFILKEKAISTGTSIFDPVLCEVMYTWFCPKKGTIFDPFAGGSVRGIVANYLDYNYVGIDLIKEQIKANIQQAEDILKDRKKPRWIIGNSLHTDKLCPKLKADFIFSCPPYFDLEQYSDSQEDLSNLDWDEFKKQYKKIIQKSCNLLKNNRFACFVVGDVRDKEGYYRNFPDLTKRYFIEAGAKFYNDIILLNVIGSISIRISKQFSSYRKVGKLHQNILLFYKGNIKEIKKNFPKIKYKDSLSFLL